MNDGRRRPYNKACGLEDFADPELSALLREIYPDEARRSPGFPSGAELRKHWEVAMSVRALRDFGALRRDAEILGVGAGTERTVFHLTRHVRRVVATDLYLAPGDWEREAHPLMLVAPERISAMPFERERLVVQHMDGRWLRFPDDSFDGIFSSGSIEHFGGLDEIAAAAYEMGRVLKPGGVLTLSTELLLDGPPGSSGWPGVVLFSPDSLRRHLVEASGLEPVDEPDLAVSERTLATCKPLLEMIREVESGRATYPHVVLAHEGQVFGSVHLTLRKTDRYPSPDNAWARPAEELREQVRRAEAEAMLRPAAPSPEPPPVAAALPQPEGGAGSTLAETLFRRWDEVRARGALDPASGGSGASRLGFLARTATRIRYLGTSADLQRDLFRTLIEGQAGLERRLQAMDAAVAGLKESEARILGALDAMWALHEKHEAAAAADPGEMANLRDRHEILRVRQARLEGELADLRDEIALLRERLRDRLRDGKT